MKNSKIIPSEPQHPRVLAEEAVSEKAQKKDVEAINKPVKLDSDEGSMTAEQLGKFTKGWAKTSRSFSDEDYDEDSSFAFAKNDTDSCVSKKIKFLKDEGKYTNDAQIKAIAYSYCEK